MATKVDQWDLPEMDGALLLADVHNFLGRFVAYPSTEAHTAHTLWIAHTHAMAAWDSTPRIAFLSPEPGSGKSRALEITALLVPRPIHTVSATPAYVFRRAADEAELPTILADEIDTVFGPRARDNEELRGFYNAGHRRGACAGRCVVRGTLIQTEELPAYCAVALAGLGNLPDTILSRSVIVRMRRRSPDEQIEPFRHRLHAPEGEILRQRLIDWGQANEMMLSNACPEMPPGVEDRAADVWEALLAVADVVSGDWPARARAAAVSLVTESSDSQASLGVRLLSDIRDIFGDARQVATGRLLSALNEIEEAPWGDLRGRPLDSRKLAKLLRPYGVRPAKLRVGVETMMGYSRADFRDAWERYLSPSLQDCRTTGTRRTSDLVTDVPDVPDVWECGEAD